MNTTPKLPEGLEPVAWGTTRTTDGKQILSEMCVATNPAYVKVHNQHLWEPLVRLSDAQAALQAQAADTARLAFLTDPKALRFVEECAGLYRVYEDKAPAAAAQHLWQSVTALYYPSAAEAIDAAIDSALLAAKEAKQ